MMIEDHRAPKSIETWDQNGKKIPEKGFIYEIYESTVAQPRSNIASTVIEAHPISAATFALIITAAVRFSLDFYAFLRAHIGMIYECELLREMRRIHPRSVNSFSGRGWTNTRYRETAKLRTSRGLQANPIHYANESRVLLFNYVWTQCSLVDAWAKDAVCCLPPRPIQLILFFEGDFCHAMHVMQLFYFFCVVLCR